MPTEHFTVTFDVPEGSASRLREYVVNAISEVDGILRWRAGTVRDGPMPASLTWPEEPTSRAGGADAQTGHGVAFDDRYPGA